MNIILVHGAWHAASCWDNIIIGLQAFASVYPVNMPGRTAENSRAYRQITLSNYVNAVESCLSQLSEPTILVGHSLAGLTISQVAENHPDKIKKIIYLTAFIPRSGECMFDITASIKTPGISTEITASPKENKIDIQPSQRTCSLFYNTTNQLLADKALNRLFPEPLKPFATPVTLSNACYGRVPKAYIKCLNDQALLPVDQEIMIKKSNISEVYFLQTDHSPFLSNPTELVNIIQECVIN
jgi:pimeloyl-ACP methyl ester carboxylesterase